MGIIDIVDLYNALKNAVSGGKLVLRAEETTGNAFLYLMFAVRSGELELLDPCINYAPDAVKITIKASMTLPTLAGTYKVEMSIRQKPVTTAGDNDPLTSNFIVSFEARDDALRGTADQVFGKVFPTYVREDAYTCNYRDILGSIGITGMSLGYSDDDYGELPIYFDCYVKLPSGGVWDSDLLSATLKIGGASGTMIGRLAPAYVDGAVKFRAKVDLSSPFYSVRHPMTGITVTQNPFDNAGAILILENAVDGSRDAVADPALYQIYVSRAYAGMSVDIKEHKTNIYGTLFGGGEYYNITADFGGGLTSRDMIGFIGNLFGLGNGKTTSLMLPDNFLLDDFALRSLGVLLRVRNKNVAINGMNAVITTTKQWKLPVLGLTLESLGINFAIQWALNDKTGTTDSYLLTGDVGASLTLKLPSGNKDKNKDKDKAYTATLNASAHLPELDFEGTIYIDKANPATGKNVIGDAAANLPEEVHVASIYAAAGYYSRTLFLSADINTDLKFFLGTELEVGLNEINLSAFFSPAGNTYRIRGIIQFGGTEDDAFSIALSAEYASGDYWTFEGGLNSGKVKIISLIERILKSEGPVSKPGSFDIELSQFYVKYQYKKDRHVNPFLLRAGFTAAWEDSPFDNLSLKAGGLVELNTDEHGELTLSALLSLAVGKFNATMQINNLGKGEKKESYIFTFMYNDKGIQASYLKDADGKGTLTVNLVNVKLGDVVEFLARFFNPDFEFTLPEPFDMLYKIDLSKFQFCYHFDDGSLDFTYKIGLNLILFKINSIGIRYVPQNTNESGDKKKQGLHITLDIEGFDTALYDGKEKGYSWNLLEERPPFLNLKGGISFKLTYLGLSSHMEDEGKQLEKATSISEAVDIIEKCKDNIEPSDKMNFIFATDFTICDALRVKFALVDPAIYGIHITVAANEGLLKNFSGFYMELLYKRISDTLGMFKASLMIPDKFRKFNFGYVKVTLGLMSAKIYTDGSFLIDLGFPHNNDFSRSFIIEFDIYIARGGLYFGILSGAACPELPRPTNSEIRGEWSPVIKMGVGITFGIGKSFDFGIVTGGFEISLTGVFEGIFAFWQKKEKTADYNDQNIYYKLSATLGIVGRLFVAVDLFVIKLEAGIAIAVYAKAQLETEKPVIIDLDLSLELYGKVTILFVSVSFTYSFSYHAHFEIGEDKSVIMYDKNRLRLSNLFNSGGFLTTEQIVDPVAVKMFMGHAITDAGKIAFVPMTTEFDCLFYLCVLWVLYEIKPDVLEKADAMLFDDKFIDENLTYDALTGFLEKNAVFTFAGLPERPSVGENLNGSIMPIMPDTVLTYGKNSKDFATYRMIDSKYLKVVDDYFKDLTPSQITKPFQTSEDTPQPIAQGLFLAYFKMILRQLLSEMRWLYENFEMAADGGYENFAELAKKYKIPVSDILTNNPSLKTRESTVICDVTYLAPEQTSFNAIAKDFGMTADDVWKSGAELYVLADSVVSFDSYTFANEYAINNNDEIAALFFARWYGDKITGYYQKLCETIQKTLLKTLNVPIDWKWECPPDGQLVLFVFSDGDEVSLHLQIGDTIESIAKSCALRLYQGRCVDNADDKRDIYDEFKRSITPSGSGFIVPMISGVPIPVYSSETPEQLVRRLFIDDSRQLLYSQNIIAKFAGIPLTNAKLNLGEGKPLTNGAENCASVDFAAALAPANFQAGQTLVIKPQQIPVAEIKAYLQLPGIRDKISGFTSRVLVQGLRLPSPPDTDGQSDSTIGLFELYGLQDDYDEAVTKFSVSLNGITTDYDIVADPVSPPISFSEQTVVRAIPPFEDSERIYGVTEKYKIDGQVLRFIPRSVQVTGNLKLNVNGVDTPFSRALCMSFDAVRTGENALSVTGIDMTKQDLLRELFDTDHNISYRVVYIPSVLSGLTATMLDSGFGAEERFFKTNLSKISKFEFEAETKAPNSELRELACDLSSRDFFPMLWECGVTCGGYALYVSDAHKLPDDIFDKNGKCKLYLLVKDVPDKAANTAVSNDILIFDSDAYFYGDGKFYSRPTMPVGYYGYYIDYNYNDQDASLFSILSYTLTVNGKETHLSKPLIPHKESGKDLAHYSAVIPVYRFFDPENPYYKGENIEGTKLNIYCRDIFGNLNDSQMVSQDIIPALNDLTLGLNDWFGVDYSYCLSESGITVTISVEKKEIPLKQLCKTCKGQTCKCQICEKLRLSGLQLEQDVNEVEIRTPFGNITGLQSKVFEFVEKLFDYYKSGGDIPQSIEEVLPNISPTADIGEIVVEFAVTRKTNIEAARESVTAIPPNLSEEELNSNIPGFEKKFGLKIAHMNHDSSKVYAIKSSLITGVEFGKSKGFWAFAPLANMLITRTVDNVNYSEVDINLWARQFLDDFENRILCDVSFLVHAGNGIVKRLLKAKNTLAARIAGTLRNLKDGCKAPPYIRDYTANLLKTRLDSEISCVNVFSLESVSNDLRLSITLNRDDDEVREAGVAAFATKLESDTAGIFYRAFSRYEDNFHPKFNSITVREFEKNIKDVRDGYERSDWYQFILPCEINASIDPETVPNPLREAPPAPGISDSEFSHNDKTDLWFCDYSLNVTTIAADQDTVNIRVEFGAISAAAKAESCDIFTALAGYMSHRDEILDLLRKKNGVKKAIDINIDTFTEKVEMIAENWEISQKSERSSGDISFTADVQLDLQKKQLRLSNCSREAKAELITPDNDIIGGKPYTFKITVPALSVYEINRAVPFVSVCRNTAMAEEFVFKTQEVSLPEVFALNVFDSIQMDMNVEALPESFKNVFELLVSKIGKDKASAGFYFELTVTYAYAFENSGTDTFVRLPTAMFKCALNDFSEQNAADFVESWYNATLPRKDKARLEFNIRISRNEKTVISIRCMYAVIERN
jgi:hypothetical protein